MFLKFTGTRKIRVVKKLNATGPGEYTFVFTEPKRCFTATSPGLMVAQDVSITATNKKTDNFFIGMSI
jgi:hypothetical protein